MIKKFLLGFLIFLGASDAFASGTSTFTNTATNTATSTATQTATNTATPTRTNTPAYVPGLDQENTQLKVLAAIRGVPGVLTYTPTATPTITPTPTITSTNSATNTATNTPTNTFTFTNTATFTPTVTQQVMAYPVSKAVTAFAVAPAQGTFLAWLTDTYGRMLINTCGPIESTSEITPGTIAGSMTPVTIVSATASTYKDLCVLTVNNTGVIGATVTLKSAGTAVMAPQYLAPGGGNYTWNGLSELVLNQNWNITSDTAAGATINYGGRINTHL